MNQPPRPERQRSDQGVDQTGGRRAEYEEQKHRSRFVQRRGPSGVPSNQRRADDRLSGGAQTDHHAGFQGGLELPGFGFADQLPGMDHHGADQHARPEAQAPDQQRRKRNPRRRPDRVGVIGAEGQQLTDPTADQVRTSQGPAGRSGGDPTVGSILIHAGRHQKKDAACAASEVSLLKVFRRTRSKACRWGDTRRGFGQGPHRPRITTRSDFQADVGWDSTASNRRFAPVGLNGSCVVWRFSSSAG